MQRLDPHFELMGGVGAFGRDVAQFGGREAEIMRDVRRLFPAFFQLAEARPRGALIWINSGRARVRQPCETGRMPHACRRKDRRCAPNSGAASTTSSSTARSPAEPAA